MAEIAGGAIAGARRPLWLRALYAVLIVAALAFVILLIGEVVYALEADKEAHETHSHGFYGPIFDGAWVVFVPTFLISLVGGLAALGVGVIRRHSGAIRYGGTALAFCGVAVLVIAFIEEA